MPHYYISPENIIGGHFKLAGQEAHHLLDVKRCKPGDIVELFDGTGKNYSARVDSASDGEITGVILDEMQGHKPVVAINLYTAVPKGERLDWLIEKAAELGVASVIPVVAARSLAKELSQNKLDRWKRLSMAASKQCGRSDVMEISGSVPLAEAFKNLSKSSLSIIPWETQDSGSINGLSPQIKKFKTINIFIGPEGGFTQHEIDSAKLSGVVPVTLGPRILRVETAGLLAAVLAMSVSGEFDANE
jgi:16S rRNA (uracil1498-N3)-methyltransferase